MSAGRNAGSKPGADAGAGSEPESGSESAVALAGGGAKLLSVTNITKSYRRKPVLRGIDMSVAAGQIVGLMGPNGAGKTTCFYAICGLIRVEQGSVHLGTTELTPYKPYQRGRLGLAYLPQESTTINALSVAQNIMAIIELQSFSKQQRRERLERLITLFSLQEIRDLSPAVLSGGQRRRVEIARCLAAEPKVVMLDEPLAGVDPIVADEIKTLIRELATTGVGILISDHNVREMLSLTDYGYVIYEGKVLFEGKPDEIARNERARKVYLGDTV